MPPVGSITATRQDDHEERVGAHHRQVQLRPGHRVPRSAEPSKGQAVADERNTEELNPAVDLHSEGISNSRCPAVTGEDKRLFDDSVPVTRLK